MGNGHISMNEYEECLEQLENWSRAAAAAKENSTPEDSAPGLRGRDLVRLRDIVSGLTAAAQSLRAIYLDVKDLCEDAGVTT